MRFAAVLAKTTLRIVADRPLLSCDLDVSIQLLGWIQIVLIHYFDTRHTSMLNASAENFSTAIQNLYLELLGVSEQTLNYTLVRFG